MTHAEIKLLPDRRVACVRGLGPYSKTLPETWRKFLEIARREGLMAMGPMLSVMHDDQASTPPEQVRSDAGVQVPDEFAVPASLEVEVVPGGLFAVGQHRGPYDKLCESWDELVNRWVPDQGRRLRPAPCYEIYENDPTVTAPEDLLTTLYLPVHK